MAILDELSGFEFEDLMEDVFRNLGYENVHQARKTADEGRDILMEEVVDGTRRGVVVECKHTGSVGRPVVQKLHSAIATYEYDGPKRGIVVTTGCFTTPAEEYATRLSQNRDPYPIELIDGTTLRDIADDIGLDLYNGRIEILCDETFRPFDPAGGADAPVREAFRDIENIDGDNLPKSHGQVDFQPILTIQAHIDAVFETSVGVIHRINQSDGFVVHANRGRPSVAESDLASVITNNFPQTVDLDEDRFATVFDDLRVNRFGQTETEYKDWAVSRLREHHTTTVTYTGDNNVTYEKTCEPKQSDISIQAITPVYVPQVRQTTQLQQYSYSYEYYAAGPSRLTLEDGIHRCVHCEKENAKTYTYCTNCGSINCRSHSKTERLEGTPVCTGCAVTERFALKTKYFYDHENLEEFRTEYAQMSVHEKAMENPLLVGGVFVTVVLLIGFILSSGLI
ncbi:restriction endonuclease (plasmid) [Haloferax mediterranei ATCC 33500]|uniref:Mrr restriction system protein-like protein n=1 Tax=Haloferax mediterranei (strain ATCC 33500 / DSM 1411 / JCM 8866 / NBRC 14739 / NCIMB 2177 / R-4) TaxID=523841 RepID=I3R9U5_HALMT|nr:restriction endonuclease [Haloferax mediterranei]AFK21005.1 Mrr restriction system protein-like protein [Haloferax mediterranei ATCC 33500]AHZ24133.1 restriction endonuclease [Haloferax mediterranei ATCC 33500]EMA05209.1 Mrr restriction system protein-like protein [Haloferax mediterranei ATCC 33500]MDX5989986.1 restriction endonuclease [Haloferax mediterranei ATCC 33500]QCQ77169.1 restriction endonuclease [Haloferax mediterranei ATCC 33500]